MTSSDKIRVYELSRDLNLENKDILDAAQKLSISVKSHSSSISLADSKKIKNLINKKNSSETIISVNKSSIESKPKKPTLIETHNKTNQVVQNSRIKEEPLKETLNNKPILIRPSNKLTNSIKSPDKNISPKRDNIRSSRNISSGIPGTKLNNENKTNSSKTAISDLKAKKTQRQVQDKKPFQNNSRLPLKSPTKPPIQLIEKPKNLITSKKEIPSNKKNNSFNQKIESTNKSEKTNNNSFKNNQKI